MGSRLCHSPIASDVGDPGHAHSACFLVAADTGATTPRREPVVEVRRSALNARCHSTQRSATGDLDHARCALIRKQTSLPVSGEAALLNHVAQSTGDQPLAFLGGMLVAKGRTG